MTTPCCMSAAHGQACTCRPTFTAALTNIEISCKDAIYVTVSHDGAEMIIRQRDDNDPSQDAQNEVWVGPSEARQLALALTTMADALESDK